VKVALQLTPEQRFIASCIKHAFAPSATRGMFSPTIDWAAVERESIEHTLAPLVHAGLGHADGAVPREFRAKVWALSVAAEVHTNTTVYPALQLTLDALAEEDIEPVVLKGAALANTAYRRPGHRLFGDLDLLIGTEHIQRAEAALFQRGFQRAIVSMPAGHHHLPPVITPDGRFRVELHTGLVEEASPYAIDAAELIARSDVHYLAGRRARVLVPEDNLLHICVHLAYGHRYDWFPLRALTDVLAITLAHSIDWPRFVASVIRSRAAGAVYWPLRLSRQWLEAPIPDAVLARLAPSAVVQWLTEPVMASPYVLDGRAPTGGGGVLYSAMRELSLYSGCSTSLQLGAVTRAVFPARDRVGHLSADLKRSRLRYSAYLTRPHRLARGALAVGRLLTGMNHETTRNSQ
jgi:hypothetical protein